ncbi:[Fe-Fe] hydrogenase large subunit C-terminal domain-containing protein [Vallitalea guaymasensis]|uniref:[Fe-Fe] hydrogenase large subunit C-terminal domain-containing protein n=1 Tax=Vallitalea guaymasensis TaxID=1185412 RepID=UPI00235446A0|nr:[Fe-Fe] hydrogenase large subunit C-terminal domain-containing protein [Vallitalea guaymasensis]
MKIMDFLPANCKNCYKCVRNCHVKAIRIVDDQAQIMEDHCIGCGQCFVVCPQNARNIKSDLSAIKNSIQSTKKMVVTLAPSYSGIYKKPKKLIAALRALGFEVIEETAIGAEIVSDLYKEYMGNHNDTKNLITSCCPSVNLLIQRYYPELLPYLLPVVSPMIAHSILLKEKYGQNSFITFVGPCISKRCEAFGYQETGDIDAILSFEELDTWLHEEGIILNDLEDSYLDSSASSYGQRYPLEGGILKGIEDDITRNGYRSVSVTGIEDCKNLFETLSKEDVGNLFIEANICANGCINGPAVSKNSENVHLRQLHVDDYLEEKETLEYELTNKRVYNRSFTNSHVTKKLASEEEIKEILKSMGKVVKEDELNCGACGYNTCREKAQAVYEGMSQPEMCIPYMRSKAEKLSNLIFESTPNIILLLDENLNIVDVNPACESAFMIHSNLSKGKALSTYIDDSDFRQVLETKRNIVNKRVVYSHYNLIVNETILFLPKQNLIMAILYDVTNIEKKNQELINLKKNTLEVADNVIEKQMRVAQEIASLLGETTAETKITLMKLQQIVLGEEGVTK